MRSAVAVKLCGVTAQVQRCGASQIDGGLHMLRKKLVHILPEVLGREATKQEFDTFFTCALHLSSRTVFSQHAAHDLNYAM